MKRRMKKHKRNNRIFSFMAIIFCAVFFGSPASAYDIGDFMDEFIVIEERSGEGGAVIKNEITASANTGGNEAKNGEVIEGGAETSADIRIEIDGEIIVDKNVKHESATGSAVIEIENVITADSDMYGNEHETKNYGKQSIISEESERGTVKQDAKPALFITAENDEITAKVDDGQIAGLSAEENGIDPGESPAETDKGVWAAIWSNLGAFLRSIMNFFDIFA